MFAYCGNNPVSRKDENGEAFETVFDFMSLGASIAEVAKDPSDLWAWAGFAGDFIDVVVPFVGGIGEIVRGAKAVSKAVDTVDTLRDIDRSTDLVGSLCFIAGTLILTDSGFVPIEDVAVGEHVWATDPNTGETAIKPVVQTFVNETDELVHIRVNDEEIVCTPEHPFYSPVKGWTAAIQLRAGDILVTVNGEYVVVEQIQHEILEAPIKVYNFEVEKFHTYYVGDDGVLVHNMCAQKNTKTLWDIQKYSKGTLPVSFSGKNMTAHFDGKFYWLDDLAGHGNSAASRYKVFTKNGKYLDWYSAA